jgi:hypothetical protein
MYNSGFEIILFFVAIPMLLYGKIIKTVIRMKNKIKCIENCCRKCSKRNDEYPVFGSGKFAFALDQKYLEDGIKTNFGKTGMYTFLKLIPGLLSAEEGEEEEEEEEESEEEGRRRKQTEISNVQNKSTTINVI